MTIFIFFYRLTLGLLPASFRERHGSDALRMAASRVREEAGLSRALRAVRELFDLLIAVRRIRREFAVGAGTSPSSRQGGRMFAGLLFDLRYACRALLRTRGFLAVALTTLGVGVALCVSVTVLVDAYLVRGLPYPESDRLHWVRYGQPGVPFVQGLNTLDWTALPDVIEHPISWDLDLFNLRGAPYPEAAEGTWVTRGYMEAFDVRPAMGRRFEPSDFEGAAPPVALISHRLWQSRFGGTPDIVGRHFEAHVNDRPTEPQTFTVVGVLPQDLWHLNIYTEVLAPLRAPSFPYMARLRDGVTAKTAARRIEALVRAGGLKIPEGWSVALVSAHDDYVLQIRPVLIALAAATVLVMLIACANVAVLFTVRATHRRREIAVRKALGASGARVGRTLAAEALAVGAAATVLGLGLAQAIVSLIAPMMDRHLGRSAPGGAGVIQIDAVTVAGALVTGALVTLVCGAAQWWAARGALAAGLAGGQKGATGGPQQRRAQRALIAVEVGACLALLVGAALMIQSGLRVLDVDMGLDTRDVTFGSITLSRARYPDAESRAALYERARTSLTAIGAVRDVSFVNAWPLQAPPVREVGDDAVAQVGPAIGTARAGLVAVSPRYFETLSIALVDGRTFSEGDRRGAEPVAMVSRTLAAKLWPGQRAVGSRLRVLPPPNAAADAVPASYLVVGVAGDVRHQHTDEDLADAYLPLLQQPSPAAFVYVRTAGAAPRLEGDVRAALATLDPDMAFARPVPLSDILDRQRAGSRFLAALLVVFAAFATALALVGIYGVIAYTVRQREREIAVRLAIGANRGTITRLFLRDGAVVLAVGLAMGVGGALLLGRLLRTQLFDVAPNDPVAIAVMTLSFGVCGLAAVAWPARRAASTSPARALQD